MADSHTPGPWHLIVDRDGGGNEFWIVVSADKRTVLCESPDRMDFPISYAASLEVAPLIQAAPELLALAREVQRYFTMQKFLADGPGAENALLAASRAAIARATGEAP